MNLVVWGNPVMKRELMKDLENIHWIEADHWNSLKEIPHADAYFLLDESCLKLDLQFTAKPIFIHAVQQTLQENNPGNQVIRMNAWPGFIEKQAWEMSGNFSTAAKQIVSALGKKIIEAPDSVGMISAPVIALIINEAFYAAEDGVSTPSEIDIAMKLGTNYPFGPFEWAEKIGISEIYTLLKTLSLRDSRYLPAASLKNKVEN